MTSLNRIEQALMIRDSWKRCQEMGLDPGQPVNGTLFKGKQLENVIRQNRELLRHATPVLEKFVYQVKQMEQVAVLVDRNGIVIHALGDPTLFQKVQDIPLTLGANWNESAMGTNAMGVALIEERPVQVRGNQHFYTITHFLTCAACPIYTPEGELAGVINISSRLENDHPLTLSIVCMIAELIQNRFIFERFKDERNAVFKEIELMSDSNSFPLLTLDPHDRILRANLAARNLLGNQCIGQKFVKQSGFIIERIYDRQNRFWGSVAINKPQKYHKEQDKLYTFDDAVGCCHITKVKEVAKKASFSSLPILLIGESGTGKELIAQSIHSQGPRRDEPFIAVNCSAIPENLIESEWFGYEAGAFTGANRHGNIGKFEAAHRGTIFLDEIGDMPLRAQAALLRVLQEKVITPIGSTKSKSIDVRVISATHRNLIEEIQAGRFRADLYYRLKGVQINLPALRDRKDIFLLLEVLLDKINYPIKEISKCAKTKLISHNWPGNIRELSNVLMQASFLADGGQIKAEHLIFESLGNPVENQHVQTVALVDTEILAIKKALHTTNWNISRAAKLLKIGRSTLYRKIEEYNIQPFDQLP